MKEPRFKLNKTDEMVYGFSNKNNRDCYTIYSEHDVLAHIYPEGEHLLEKIVEGYLSKASDEEIAFLKVHFARFKADVLQEKKDRAYRKEEIKKLSASMNEFMTRRSTCNCCSDMDVDVHAAKLFDFSLDDPPPDWKK